MSDWHDEKFRKSYIVACRHVDNESLPLEVRDVMRHYTESRTAAKRAIRELESMQGVRTVYGPSPSMREDVKQLKLTNKKLLAKNRKLQERINGLKDALVSKRFYSKAEAAKVLGSTRLLEKLIQSGELRAKKVGRSYLIPINQVDNLLDLKV